MNIENLFDDISDSFKNRGSSGTQFEDILSLKTGNEYVVRLVPYIKNPKNTIFPIIYHGWISESTGKYVEFMSPRMIDLPDPISKESWEIGKKLKPLGLSKDDERMKKARQIWEKQAWLVNAYVIKDPTNSENEGTVKVLRMGKTIHDIVRRHFDGADSQDFGLKIFDLSPKGCNFKVRVTEKAVAGEGTYPQYGTSVFSLPCEIEGVGDSEEKIREIYDQCHDLSTMFPIKEYDELKEALQIHYYGEVSESTGGRREAPSLKSENSESDISNLVNEAANSKPEEKAPAPVEQPKEESKPEAPKSESDEFDVDSFLANLDK